MLQKFKELCNRSSYRNVRFVKVRESRLCEHCGEGIATGVECVTVNRKYKGRRWYCLKCVDLALQISEVKAQKDAVAFGDEGMWLALDDYQAKLESEFYN